MSKQVEKHTFKSKHLEQVSLLMEHPEFKEFFDTALKDWDSTRATIMHMKLYKSIGNYMPDLTPYEKVKILRRIIDDKEMRSKMCTDMINWSTSSSKDGMNRSVCDKNTLSIDFQVNTP